MANQSHWVATRLKVTASSSASKVASNVSPDIPAETLENHHRRLRLRLTRKEQISVHIADIPEP